MSFKELWHNGAKRLLLVLICVSLVILLVVGGVAAGIFYLTIRIQNIDSKVESVSDIQGDISGKVEANTASITDLSSSVNEGWQTFQRSNPTQPVPQIADVQVPAEGKTEVVIKPPLAKPKASPTPKTKTIIKYRSRSRPTPKPFKLFGK